MSKTWGFCFGGSGHGPESTCQISAYCKFFPGKSYFYRTIYGLWSPSEHAHMGTTWVFGGQLGFAWANLLGPKWA